jgi:hypothetical protein
MENNTDKNIEKLVERMLQEVEPDKPSIDFTTKVMADALALNKNRSMVYEPLLSRRTWILIFLGIITVFIYSYITIGATPSGFNLNFTVFNLDRLEKILPSVQISSVTGNVILFAALMVLIQILFLKKYLDKRFES